MNRQQIKNAIETKLGSAAKRQAGMKFVNLNRRADDDALRLMAEIPRDTRNLTAMIMGDPLPGRSALDRRSVR